MLAKQTVCHIPAQHTVLRDASSRPSSPEWNIQQTIEPEAARRK